MRQYSLFLRPFIYGLLVFKLLILSAPASFGEETFYPEFKQLRKYYRKLTPDNRKKINHILFKYNNDFKFKNQLGEFYLYIRKPLNAEIVFKELQKEQPKDIHEIGIAKALLAQRKYDEVVQLLRPNSLVLEYKVMKHFLYSQALYGKKEYKDALKMLNNALEMSPKKTEPTMHIFKARILTSLERPEDSQKILQNLQDYKKNQKEVNIINAENYILLKNYFKAHEIYNQIILRDEDSYEGYSGRAKVNLLMKRSKEAIKDGLKMLNIKYYHPMGFYILASAYLQQNRFDEAYDIFNGRSEKFPGFHRGVLLEAEIQAKTGHSSRAQILLNQYIRVRPNDVKALNLLGILKMRSGNIYDAINFFKHARKINDFDAYSTTALAYAYYKANKYDRSQFFFDLLQTRFPQYAYITRDASRLACNLPTTKFLEAPQCQTLKTSEIAAQIFDAIGQVHIGNHENALKQMKQLTDIYPSDLLVQRYYGRILSFSGQYDAAVNLFLKLMKRVDTKETRSILHELYSIYVSGHSSIDILNRLYKEFENNPHDLDMGYHLANFFYREKNLSQAMKIIDTMIKHQPTNVSLHETAFKVMSKDPGMFKHKIKDYYVLYKKNSTNTQLITRLRKKYINQQIQGTPPEFLAKTAHETTHEDYLIYARYLDYIEQTQMASDVYDFALEKFNTNYALFLSAFEFFAKNNNIEKIEQYIQQFSIHNKISDLRALEAYKVFIQGNKPAAFQLIRGQFAKSNDVHSAQMMLKIEPKMRTVTYITKHVKKINKAKKFPLVMEMARIAIENFEFTKAGTLLYPYYQDKTRDIDYLYLLSQVTFYTDFTFGYRLIKDIIHFAPHNTEYLSQFVKYEAKRQNYYRAIELFKSVSPDIQKRPDIYFYYAYALFKVGHKEKVKQVLQKIVKNDNNFIERENAQDILKELNEI